MQAKIEDGIGWMVFNNPARHNALSLEMWEGMGDILEHFASNDAVRVIVMRGAAANPSCLAQIFRNSISHVRTRNSVQATACCWKATQWLGKSKNR